MKTICLFTYLVIMSMSASCQSTYWTEEKQRAYAASRTDSTLWDMEMLKRDIEYVYLPSMWPTKPALSPMPIPVPTYETPGGFLMGVELEIDQQLFCGFTIGWGKGAFNAELYEPEDDFVHHYFTILVLLEDTVPELRAATIVSRNHPNYVATGRQILNSGQIDWVQLAIADGNNYALINQILFDLRAGATLVVFPMDDGSLRVIQLEGPRTPRGASFETYLNGLKQSEKLKSQLKQSGVLLRK